MCQYFPRSSFLVSPQLKQNCGYSFAVAAGSFFIQPLGSSCGFCSAAPAVVLEPIPHHPHRLVRQIKVSPFSTFGFNSPSPPPLCKPSSPVSRWEARSPLNPPLSPVFPSPSRFESTNSGRSHRSSGFEQGRTTAVGFARLAVGSTLQPARTSAAPEPEYFLTLSSFKARADRDQVELMFRRDVKEAPR